LLDKYGNLDDIFANVGEIGGKLGEKLVAGKDMAYLSKELATINVDAPIDVKLDDLTYDFPFDEKVRELFGKYNFKSLYKKEELFCKPQKTLFSPQIQEIKAEDIKIKGDFALHLDDKVYIGDEENNFIINVSQTLFGEFDSEEKIFDVLKPYIENEKRLKVVFDYKGLLKKFEQYDIKPKNVFDIKLGQYLIAKDADFSQFSTLLKDYGFEPSGYGAYKVYLAQKQLLGEFNLDKLYYEVELPLEEVLFSMEKEGFKVDTNELKRLGEYYNLARPTQYGYSAYYYTYGDTVVMTVIEKADCKSGKTKLLKIKTADADAKYTDIRTGKTYSGEELIKGIAVSLAGEKDTAHLFIFKKV